MVNNRKPQISRIIQIKTTENTEKGSEIRRKGKSGEFVCKNE